VGLGDGGGVPPSLFGQPWSVPAISREKYFAATPIAMWAGPLAGRPEGQIIAALIARLCTLGVSL